MPEEWGILRPDDVPSARRLQSLGLTRSVRRFNERTVPGTGGLWFAMPLCWSILGIALAEHKDVRRRPIELANAIEALAMKLAITQPESEENQRVKGQRNLPGVDESFAALRKPGAYVSQPFRQSCTQPLMSLGLVTGTNGRFNSYRLSEDGARLANLFSNVRSDLEKWISSGKRANFAKFMSIRPAADLPSQFAVDLLSRIYGADHGSERRRAIRDVVDGLSSNSLLDAAPKGLAEDHLLDIRGGIALFRLRSAALAVLDAIERHIQRRRDHGLRPELELEEASRDKTVREKMRACVEQAGRLGRHIRAAREPDSIAFLAECEAADGLIRRLARRDGVVIVLRDDVLVPGPAFGAQEERADGPDVEEAQIPELPRIASLLALTKDLSQAVGGRRDRAAIK